MAWVAYDTFKSWMANGCAPNFGAAGDTLKVLLTTSAYVPDQTTHAYKKSITNEVTGSNYTAGGATLASKTATVSSHVLTFDSADITWLQHATGFSNARIAVLWKDISNDSLALLIAYYDLTSDRGNVAGDLVLGTPSGIFTF